MMTNESIPKVFISYSWTSEERVIELAQRLVDDGVDVVLDKWDLKEGQDKYAFMERSVTDLSIGKVLMICDESYTEKANDRTGGVGDETMVISPEVYRQTAETKYIPIIFERDDNGKEHVPAYLKTRIYIDLCADNPQYEHEYEKLLRNLHEKPEHRKPTLGKMPEWLNDETVELSGVRNLLKQIQSHDGKNRNKVEFIIREFNDKFLQTALTFAPKKDENFDSNLLIQIDLVKPLRDFFFEYLKALIMSDVDVGTVIDDFFESLYNGTHSRIGSYSYSDDEFEFSEFLIWEMFVGSTAILLHYEKYAEINRILNRTYFIKRTPYESTIEPTTYKKFISYLKYIEEVIKPKSANPKLYTMVGDIAVKREKLPIINRYSLVNADLILFQLSCTLNFTGDVYHRYWFPRLYIYADRCLHVQPIWSKMVSRKHCEKLFPLFGVSDIKKLIEMVKKSKQNDNIRYLSSDNPAVPILQSIKPETIGTMP